MFYLCFKQLVSQFYLQFFFGFDLSFDSQIKFRRHQDIGQVLNHSESA